MAVFSFIIFEQSFNFFRISIYSLADKAEQSLVLVDIGITLTATVSPEYQISYHF